MPDRLWRLKLPKLSQLTVNTYKVILLLKKQLSLYYDTIK